MIWGTDLISFFVYKKQWSKPLNEEKDCKIDKSGTVPGNTDIRSFGMWQDSSGKYTDYGGSEQGSAHFL